MENFLQETKNAIKESGHTVSDVMFIGSDDGEYRISWRKFESIANFEYDSGFGQAEIPTSLIIYFKDQTYIQREEYDGSEWWEVHAPKLFSMDQEYKDFDLLRYDWYGKASNPQQVLLNLIERFKDEDISPTMSSEQVQDIILEFMDNESRTMDRSRTTKV